MSQNKKIIKEKIKEIDKMIEDLNVVRYELEDLTDDESSLDVPYVPSSWNKVRQIMEFADVQSGMKMCDLGSGDGRIVIECAKKGAYACGYELSNSRVLLSQKNINRENLKNVAFIVQKDFFKANLSSFDLVTVYGITGIMKRLESKLQKELRAGAKVISNHFPFPNWQPAEIKDDVYLYIK